MKPLLSYGCASFLGLSLFLAACECASAISFVAVSNSFGSVTITPASGTLSFTSPLQTAAFAQAGANGQYSALTPSVASATDIPAPGSLATGAGTALLSPMSGSSRATGLIDGTTVGFDTSTGQASANGVFQITGASGPVRVTFSVVINGELTLFTDAYGVAARGESVFALSINGIPDLFSDIPLSIGPNQTQILPFSQTLSDTMTLMPNTPYWLFEQADSEALVINSSTAVPDSMPGPGMAGYLALSLFLLFWLRQRQTVKQADRLLLTLLGTAVVGAGSAYATYIGSEAPDICQTCGAQPTRQSVGAISTSLTEGTIREDYPVVTVRSDYGPTLSFALTYNSYNADGSRAQLDVGVGFGWTHTYNALLFQQRGQMFRLGPDGRVTQYFMKFSGTGGTYTSDTGYFETLTQQPDGTFYITNKNQSWWHFGSVPNTSFFVAGPVYRLLQTGDRNGNVTSISYDAGGRLVSATDPFNRTLQFSYDSHNHLTGVTDPLGRTTQFQYDSLNRVPTQITDPLGNTVQYTYNSQYQITRKVDRDGRMCFYTYKGLEPFMVTDGSGQAYFSMANPTNWSVNSSNLAFSLRRSYNPSATTSTDGNGHAWQYAYDTNGYITQVTAPDGTTTRYTYDPATREVSSVTDANGHVSGYQYDPEGNRIRTTDALGEVTIYTYEPVFNMMTSMTDPDGRTTTWQYDANGNRIKETDPLLQTRSWTYDIHGNGLTSTDKEGYTTTNQYNSSGELTSRTDPLGNVTTYTYDPVGNLLSTTDPLGRATRNQYDALDRLIGTTNALNGVTTYTYDPLDRRLSMTDPNTNTTTYQYDLRGRVTQTTDALGGVIRDAYDPNNNRIATTNQLGHPTTYSYDSLNRVVGTTNAIGGVTRYTYDPVGNRISVTDPNTNTTLSAYDALNRVVSTTNAIGGVTSYAYSMPGGPPCCSPTPGSSLITRMQDANGNVTFYHYDELNRRVQVVRKNSDTNDMINPTDAVTTTAYDPNNNIIAVTDPNANTTVSTFDPDNRQTNAVNAAGDTTITRYDPDGNVIAVTAPNNNATTNVYDALNRVIILYDEIGLVRSNAYDPNGNVLSTTDGLGHTTRDVYDGLNRQIEVIDALGQTTTTIYDPDSNVTSTTDRNGHITEYFYDGLDRRTSITDALGKTNITTYDPDSNVIGLTDANGHTTSYGYDGLNRRVTETYPDTPPNTRTNVYDAVGNIISRIDQKGQVTTYSYNDLYFMTNRAYSPSGANDSFNYDLAGRILTANRNGWKDTFAYDGANRVTNATQNGRTITYRYNIPGRVQTNTYSSGRTLNYTYDARSRFMTLDDGTLNPPIVTYVYDDVDRVVTRMYRNSTTATYTYNANNWITSLNHSNATSLIAGFSYGYDNEGNKSYEQKLHNPTNSEAYLYDSVDRLTNYDVGTLAGSIILSPTLAKAWNLDPVGNWNTVTSNGVPEVRTHGPSNELLTDNGSNYLYDADGNLAQDTAYKYAYDEERRLILVQRLPNSAIVGQYFYDALNRRVAKIADPAGIPSTNFYFYDGARIVEEQNAGGATQATYTYGNYIDEVLTMDRGGQTFYYHQNTLSSPHALTDSSGNVAERYVYDVYGLATVLDASYNPTASNPWGTPHSAEGNIWFFTSRQLDEESGLYFYRTRFYDAAKGRFLQRDPAGYLDSLNAYESFLSAPTDLLDPTGLSIRIQCDIDDYLKENGITGYTKRRSGDVRIYSGAAKFSEETFEAEVLWRMIRNARNFPHESNPPFRDQAALERHIRVRSAIVNNARHFKAGFGDDAFSKTYWSGTSLKPGVTSTTAIQDIWINPKDYSADCMKAGHLILLGAFSDVLDDKEFDKLTQNNPLANVAQFIERRRYVADEDWIPGDWGRIEYNNARADWPSRFHSGENIIYLGGSFATVWATFSKEAEFFGHGFGIQTLDKYLLTVTGWSKATVKKNATIQSHRDFPAAK
jgi:RHS repeat-associated protein